MRSDLLRTSTIALVMALVGNLWLVWLSSHGDTFAEVVGISSIVIAALIVLTYAVGPLRHWLGECYLLSLALWTANLIELWTDDNLRRATQVRQGGFYSALAIVSLGCYLTTRVAADRR